MSTGTNAGLTHPIEDRLDPSGNERRCKRVGNEPGYGSPDDDRMIHGTTPRSDTCPGAGSGLRATAMKRSVTPRGTLSLPPD